MFIKLLLDVDYMYVLVDGLGQDCGIFSANALEIPQSCTKPSTYLTLNFFSNHWFMIWLFMNPHDHAGSDKKTND